MWFFSKLRACDKLRNPIQGEFFATSATGGPAQALVRESIQNSLDAHVDRPVRVAIKVAVVPTPSQDDIDRLFEGAWEHFAAEGNGLREPRPGPGDACPSLVVEDFNTSGLTGDPAETNPLGGTRNHFYNFFRAEGVSGKSGTELGRWGVGKFVFPRSSRASSHFAITVRSDDQRRLMLGAVTLKGHHVDGNTALFTPDALYGEQRDDELVLPIEDSNRIDEVANLFGLQRRHEPGTSIIVPFIEPEDFTFEKLVNAVVGSYFVPILHGDLEVEIRHDEREAVLRSDTLITVLEENRELAADLLPLVRLTKHAASIEDQDRIVLNMPDPARSAKWSDALIDEDALQKLRAGLSGYEPISVRVPVTVKSTSDGDSMSCFDIHLLPERNCKERPVFVREGIIVSGVRDRRIREIRSLVIVKHQPLAEMLGNSENPAHTEWQKDGSNFKGHYVYGSGLINFVSQSVSQLLGVINKASREPDPSLTVDFFSIEPQDSSDHSDEVPRPSSKPGSSSDQAKPEVTARPTRLVIHRSQTGFSIEPGAEPPPVPFTLEVRCAYETRNGNPLKKWNAADFTLGLGGLPETLSGDVAVITARNNRLLLRVTDHDFRIEVDGFDTNRDLYVRADVKGAGHADSQA